MEQKDNIFDYFGDEVEFPENIAVDIMPYGTLWSYVSATFLNGFINYVDILAGFVIDRYTKRDGKAAQIEAAIKTEVHTNLRVFKDDVIVLGRIGKGKYMFFYFDYDVSDCMIGRFITDDNETTIVQSIVNWLERCKAERVGLTISEHTESGILDYTSLPVKFFRRWISY